MKFSRSIHEEGYVKSMLNAESKGFAAGEDPQFSESDNPYRRFEHRKCWLDGFLRARAPQAFEAKR